MKSSVKLAEKPTDQNCELVKGIKAPVLPEFCMCNSPSPAWGGPGGSRGESGALLGDISS